MNMIKTTDGMYAQMPDEFSASSNFVVDLRYFFGMGLFFVFRFKQFGKIESGSL